MTARILVVDDDTALAEMIGIVLRTEGFEPSFCGDGGQALAAFHDAKPDLVLLDLMLPGLDGIQVCDLIRAESGVPIIMLTAKSDTADVVKGLESGADDYIVKPFNPKELVARIRTRLRPAAAASPGLLQVGDLVVDVEGHEVRRGEERINLTPLEFDLLHALASRPQQVFTREMLLEQVWGYQYKADTRLVNVHVQRLRAKVEDDPDNPRIVMTVRGVGYRAGPRPSPMRPLPVWLVDWRSWPRRLTRIWSVSLQFRTVLITVALSGVTVLLIGVLMTQSISSDLFRQRLDTVLQQSNSATSRMQEQFTSSDASDQTELEQLRTQVFDELRGSAINLSDFAFRRTPGTEARNVLQNASTADYVDSLLSADLRRAVGEGTGTQQWQSVAIPVGDQGATSPGIVVGSSIDIPSAGRYELYLVYDLGDIQQTLDFVAGTILLAFLFLIVLIGAIAWLVVRLVVAPIRVAADTSQKLAAGQLEERLPVKGEDVIATLARSFNGMADSLQSQITQLADLSQLQQRFVSDVSHELRTPLTTIRLAGGVLYDLREDFSPPAARSAELLHTQVERFETLLADLLEISRFDAGAVDLVTEPTNLVRLVEDSIEEFEGLAAQKGSELRLVAPGGYFDAEMDARRVRRIVTNLVGNAVDHGEGRPIVITVDSDRDAVALAVRDYGVGMTHEEMGHVFDRFWRADPSRQRTTGGTGLGLAISLEDTNLHHGWLQLWSRPGEGSCFRLTLPRRPDVPLDSSPVALPPDDPADDRADEEDARVPST
ncbi:Sensor histidine kinase MtrB [Clavibacter michiganensis subsp. michiganensis]|nr:MtrAB system histidine kinase MtrB [Clavibacter michiganensis]OUD82388.1 Sensor histidine kinase MtrB [Clavibacter michiganensis subsp. michiganensis]